MPTLPGSPRHIAPDPPRPAVPTPAAADDADAGDIRRALAGDPRGFEALVLRHGPRVHDLARRMLRDVQRAEDITQHAFTNAWKALPRFDLARPFRNWILRIATNLCRNAHAARRLSPEVSGTGPEDEPFDPPAPPPPAPPDADDLARAEHVHAAIASLPERYRLPVVLHHVHGLSLEAIAEITEVPLATVKTHLHRGRAALRDLLAPEIDPGETGRRPGGTTGHGTSTP